MPALNFKPRFYDAIKCLEKRQTIRKRGKRPPPKVGDPLFLYTGMRTMDCRKILDASCKSVEPISISIASQRVQMVLERFSSNVWETLDVEEVSALAKADGFENSEAFFAFFHDEYGSTFSGYLIKW